MSTILELRQYCKGIQLLACIHAYTGLRNTEFVILFLVQVDDIQDNEIIFIDLYLFN